MFDILQIRPISLSLSLQIEFFKNGVQQVNKTTSIIIIADTVCV